MEPKIRFIVEFHRRAVNVNGNRYTLVEVTSTKTGKSLMVNTGWGDGFGIHRFFKAAGIATADLYRTVTIHKITAYNDLKGYVSQKENYFEKDEIKAEHIQDLEKGYNNAP